MLNTNYHAKSTRCREQRQISGPFYKQRTKMKESTINSIFAAILASIATAALVAVFLGHTQHIITLAICSGLASLMAGEARRIQMKENSKTIQQ